MTELTNTADVSRLEEANNVAVKTGGRVVPGRYTTFVVANNEQTLREKPYAEGELYYMASYGFPGDLKGIDKMYGDKRILAAIMRMSELQNDEHSGGVEGKLSDNDPQNLAKKIEDQMHLVVGPRLEATKALGLKRGHGELYLLSTPPLPTQSGEHVGYVEIKKADKK
jgi:hypothetical protein